MHLPSYEIFEKAEDLSEFKFISSGPNGNIVKLVIFKKFPFVELYNLSLLDVVGEGLISDSSISNNNDLRKILATTVHVIIEYLTAFPERTIFFQGSDEDDRRISIYQRAILQYLRLLEGFFYIEGITHEGTVEEFDPLQQYQSFLVKRE